MVKKYGDAKYVCYTTVAKYQNKTITKEGYHVIQ